MTKEEASALSDAEAMARARELAQLIGGSAAARRVTLLPPEQVRNFLVANSQ